MPFDLLHPRDQILEIMRRIYRYGMTTTSGGNLSTLDENGDLWITPAGIDKGGLGWDDIVCIPASGQVDGRRRPSSEYPFHRSIYECRPDLGAIVHAHPTALVAFSLVRKVPNTLIIPHANAVCGNIGIAKYALPGSAALGNEIAKTFADGYDCVILENHGIVCGGTDLLHAFHRFETLDFCARLAIKASSLGKCRFLSEAQARKFHHTNNLLPEFAPGLRTARERELRKQICDVVHRAYDQQLMIGTQGVVSARLGEDGFLVTPSQMDRRLIEISDIVHVRNRAREEGKFPSRSVLLHAAIFEAHPWVNAIVTAQPPNSTAFAVCDAPFQTRSIPESYILLQNIKRIPYGPQFDDGSSVAKEIQRDSPVLLLENDAVLAVGNSILQAFDRLEVAEFSARSLIQARSIGDVVPIGDSEIGELRDAFLSDADA